MESVGDIYAEIAAGSPQSSVLFEELECMGWTPAQIRRGVDAARARLEAASAATAPIIHASSPMNALPRHGGFGASSYRDAG